MNLKYRKPSVVSYDRAEIMEMMGPLKTQYGPPPPPPPLPTCDSCSGVQVAPGSILQFKEEDLSIEVDTGGCTEFQTVEVEIPGSSPFVFYSFDRGNGTLSGTTWSTMIDAFQFTGDRGTYDVVVTLVDGNGDRGSSCQAQLTID